MTDETNDTESGLLAAARKGDRAALTKLLERHQQKVFGFGVKMCGDSSADRSASPDRKAA